MIRRIQNLNEQTVLRVLIMVALASLAFSALSHWVDGSGAWWAWADSAFQNFSTEMMGAVLTFFLFELVIGVRNEKKNLLIQLRSKDNATALNALAQIRANGWHRDGTLKAANLREANLQQANLSEAKLQQADLSEANLQDANLWAANLQDADLREANLQQADLEYAQLQQAKLNYAKLQQAKLKYANLQQAVLRRANLRDANLQDAEFNEKTVLPDAAPIEGEDGNLLRDEKGSWIYDKYWTLATDMTRYTNPEHPAFWEPAWVKEQRK
jgi:uncharacterized protein YjbI with pentapeptide repeats